MITRVAADHRLWARARMLDVIHKSMKKPGRVAPSEVLKTAAIAYVTTLSDKIYHFLASKSDREIKVSSSSPNSDKSADGLGECGG